MRGGGKKVAEATVPVVQGWLPFWPAVVCAAIGCLYLVGLVSGQTKGDIVGKAVPALVQHFLQAPGLFPDAAEKVIDYRLEAWSCADKAFVEVDVRPYFPMRPDDKENRFFRLASFYRSAPTVLGAFDDWFSAKNKTGGVRISSLRLPIPPPGQIQPFTRAPIASLPDSVKKVWYQTTLPERNRRCAQPAPGATP